MQNNPAINFIGPVDDVMKYYRESSVAIVPLLTGSGTRLKIMEAMSFGNPVVSTGTGAEGLLVKPNNNIFIADTPQDFANAIANLIENKSLFEATRLNASQLVRKEYDWSVSGGKMNNAIEQLLR